MKMVFAKGEMKLQDENSSSHKLFCINPRKLSTIWNMESTRSHISHCSTRGQFTWTQPEEI
ncbi:MAG TPA: hypothetical protein VJ461_01330 [Candidatus Nanoarchaeia archaeon]|nr:hypothetical protein [Candidatus Nanoarchaeia archaeon]